MRARALFLRCLSALCLVAPLSAAAQIQGAAVFLVATPKMSDPRFTKTVILVTRHGRSPPLGVVINRPLGVKLGDVLPQSFERPSPSAKPAQGSQAPALPNGAQTPLYFGGPVGAGSLVYLFRSEQAPPSDAIVVAKDVHLGRAPESLDELLSGKRVHSGLKVFTGYAGWAFGQLEHEIARGQWDVLEIDREYLFDKDVEVIWPELHRRARQVTARIDRPIDGPWPSRPGPSFLFPSS
jgi:putative transcriptional regulator